MAGGTQRIMYRSEMSRENTYRGQTLNIVFMHIIALNSSLRHDLCVCVHVWISGCISR